MKFPVDTKKGTLAATNILHKTAKASSKTVATVQNHARVFADKAKSENQARRIKKYRPIFSDVYSDPDFCVPNIIQIVDGSKRKNIDVCQGAIGWLSSSAGNEVLHLYDEAVATSGLTFIPPPTCDSFYYVDSFDRTCFIRTDHIFERAHNSRLAELKHIANSLGAKKCSIELREALQEKQSEKKKFSITARAPIKAVASSTERAEANFSQKESQSREGRVEALFRGNSTPEMPELKWFAYDDNIKRLIDSRFNSKNPLTSETYVLTGDSSATMTRKTACEIDNTINKISAKGTSSMEAQVQRESRSKLVFIVEF